MCDLVNHSTTFCTWVKFYPTHHILSKRSVVKSMKNCVAYVYHWYKFHPTTLNVEVQMKFDMFALVRAHLKTYTSMIQFTLLEFCS